MFVSGLLRCPVCFISVFFFFLSLMGALSWEGRVDDTLVSKTTHLSIRYVFFSVLCSDWRCPYDEAASPLHYFFHRKKCTFLETGSESSTIPKNLFMHLKRLWTFTHFFFFFNITPEVCMNKRTCSLWHRQTLTAESPPRWICLLMKIIIL